MERFELFIILGFGLLVSLILLMVLIRKKLGWIVAGIPKVPKSETQQLQKKERERMYDLLPLRYGRTYYINDLPCTSDKELAGRLLKLKVHGDKRSILYRFFANVMPDSDGLLFMEGETWKRHHNAVTDLFQGPAISRYAENIHSIAEDCLIRWTDPACGSNPSDALYFELAHGSNGSTEFSDLLHAFRWMSVRVLLEWAYGLDSTHPTAVALGREVAHYSRVLFDLIPRHSNLRAIAMYPQLWTSSRRLRRLVKTVVDEDLAQGVPVGRDSLLSRLVKKGFPFTEIVSQVNHLHGAHKAAALGATVAIFELCHHPDWQERLRKEMDEVLGGRPYPTREDLNNMKEFDIFLKEVLRMHVVSLAVARRTGQAIEVFLDVEKTGNRSKSSVVIPGDTEILVSLHGLHHDPEYWDDPYAFRPERFLDERGNVKDPSKGAYFPFLDGHRKCAGVHLATLEIAIFVTTVIRKYRVSTPLPPRLLLLSSNFTTIETDIPVRLDPLST